MGDCINMSSKSRCLKTNNLTPKRVEINCVPIYDFSTQLTEMASKLFLALMSFSFITSIEAQSKTHLKDIYTLLFTTNTYNKEVRPIDDQSQPVLVYIDFYLLGINNLDESEQKLTTTAYIILSWEDSGLTWDPSSYGGIEYFYVSQDKIWKPDVSLKNGFTKLKELGGSFLLVQVDSSGNVLWIPYEVFESKCSINIKYYPFDTQNCTLEFVVWSHSVMDVELLEGSKGIILDQYENSSTWDIVKTEAEASKDSMEATVYFRIFMQRKPLSVLINLVLPIVVLTLLDLVTFVMPSDAGEKMGYTITVSLAFAVYLTIMTGELPDNAQDLSMLSTYLLLQLLIMSCIIVAAAYQLRVRFREENRPVGRFHSFVVRASRKIRCVSKENQVVDQNDTSLDIDWMAVSNALDFFFFWFFLIAIFTTTIITFGVAAVKGSAVRLSM